MVAIDGTICAILNQPGRDGTTFAAFNKKYFEEDITFDGSMQELADMLAQTDILEDAVSLLWDVNLSNMYSQMGYEYDRGVLIDVETGEVSCP